MTAKTIFFILLAISILQKETARKEKPKEIPAVLRYSEFHEVSADDIKKFILKYNKKLDEETAREISVNIVKYSEIYNIDPKLITSLIARESRFNPNATSSSGALGLGQLIPSTAKEVGVDDPYDIEQNIRGTVLYFKKMLDMWKDNSQQIDLALASYRIGHKTVKQYNDIPPIPEVQEFIESIKKIYSEI